MRPGSSPDVQPSRDTNAAVGPSCPAGPASTSGNNDTASFCTGWSEAKRYTVQEVIGKGSYGVVCSAIDNVTGQLVAIKKIQNVFENVADAVRILREIKLLRVLKHPDVVDIKHILLPSDPRSFRDLYVVFELMESDLHTVISANDDLTHDHHKVFLYQLLRGLNFMHQSGVLHRDLKPKNILANSNCKLKICDFGLARPYTQQQPMSPVFWTDYVATRWYRAPELCGCFYGRYTQAVDIWSIGCIFAEVLLRAPLFPGRDAVSQLQIITDLLGKPPQSVIDSISNQRARAFLNALPAKPAKAFEEKFPNADPACLDLLRTLLSFDPAERPTAAEALAHSYFKGLPSAVAQEAVNVSQHFGFEQHKLSEADVRLLIYQEVLNYHPQAAAAYTAQQQAAAAQQQQRNAALQQMQMQMRLAAHAQAHVRQNPYTLAGNQAVDNVRMQFMLAEQYNNTAAALAARSSSGGGAAPAPSVTWPWPQHPAASAAAACGGDPLHCGETLLAAAAAAQAAGASVPTIPPGFGLQPAAAAASAAAAAAAAAASAAVASAQLSPDGSPYDSYSQHLMGGGPNGSDPNTLYAAMAGAAAAGMHHRTPSLHGLPIAA